MDSAIQYLNENYKLSSLELTAVDSLLAKLSCVYRGYIKYVELTSFVSGLPLDLNNFKFRLPLINKAYYIRMYSIRTAINNFFKKLKDNNSKSAQIINLGCGLDPLHLYVRSLSKENCINIKYIDVDQPAIIEMKSTAIKSYKFEFLEYQTYILNVNDKILVKNFCDEFDIYNTNTLIICECLLTYLEIDVIENLLQTFLINNNISWVSFDLYNTKDRFGKRMLSNFEIAGAPIKGPKNWTTPEEVEIFFKKFICESLENKVNIKKLSTCYESINEDEKKRVSSLEILDEIEEITLIEEHSIICTVN